MEETLPQVLVESCERTGVTFGWKHTVTVTDPASQGSGGTQRADCSGGGGQGQGASAEEQEDPLEKTMVGGLRNPATRGGENRRSSGDNDMEEGELGQNGTQSQFADNNI